LLKSLVMAGMAQQTPDRKFTVGNGFHALAAQSLRASGILGASHPVLETLRRFGGIVALGVLWKREVAYLYFSDPSSPAGASISSRESLTATESSIGMMLLAQQPTVAVDMLYKDGNAAPFADVSVLKSELAIARERGYAQIITRANNKSHPSEAVGIRQNGAYVAAIAMSNVPGQFPQAERIAALRGAADEIENAMKHPINLS
jgi:DNA-binding IclR family transcriptional regulator